MDELLSITISITNDHARFECLSVIFNGNKCISFKKCWDHAWPLAIGNEIIRLNIKIANAQRVANSIVRSLDVFERQLRDAFYFSRIVLKNMK